MWPGHGDPVSFHLLSKALFLPCIFPPELLPSALPTPPCCPALSSQSSKSILKSCFLEQLPVLLLSLCSLTASLFTTLSLISHSNGPGFLSFQPLWNEPHSVPSLRHQQQPDCKHLLRGLDSGSSKLLSVNSSNPFALFPAVLEVEAASHHCYFLNTLALSKSKQTFLAIF